MPQRLAQRTDEFRVALSGIESVEPFDFGEDVLRDLAMLNAGLLTRNALYVRDPQADLGRAPFGEFEFEPNPSRLRGETDSHHGVIFGDLHTYDNNFAVAVKPYDGGRATAVREHVAYEFMIKTGFEGFRPLGIVACNGTAFLLTVDMPSLKTLNNMRWSPVALEKGDMGDEQIDLLGAVASELGEINAIGATHGDAQPKNAALSERGVVSLIDLESFRYNPSEIDSPSMNSRISGDILNFYDKLRKWYGYCKDEDKKTRFAQFDKHFLQPYFQAYTTARGGNSLDPQAMTRFRAGIRVAIMKYVVTEEAPSEAVLD